MATTVSQLRDQPNSMQTGLSPNAMTVLEDRYLLRDDNGHIAETPAELSNYNLSVAMTDAFMESLQVSPGEPHVAVNPHTGQSGLLSKDSNAVDCDRTAASDGDKRHYTVREVWERIVHRAWQSGDPGLVFIDEVNRNNQTPQLGEIRATNPCGEQPLLPYEACKLVRRGRSAWQ